MNFEFVDWNVKTIQDEIRNGLSETDFVSRGLIEGQYKNFRTEDQATLLKAVYQIVLGIVE